MPGAVGLALRMLAGPTPGLWAWRTGKEEGGRTGRAAPGGGAGPRAAPERKNRPAKRDDQAAFGRRGVQGFDGGGRRGRGVLGGIRGVLRGGLRGVLGRCVAMYSSTSRWPSGGPLLFRQVFDSFPFLGLISFLNELSDLGRNGSLDGRERIEELADLFNLRCQKAEASVAGDRRRQVRHRFSIGDFRRGVAPALQSLELSTGAKALYYGF